ncbi:response regulator transcription factor [Adlercreutzia sp. ZJ473]|uniref:response regulator transcription factor n=1 Tax=Adlercreutzia sp. ZJ473 TaxID=2722822 RepID=UPI001556210F|nr:helix-turn-helix transcriptional regulator [Adlercreutzia sp. ZJ473]
MESDQSNVFDASAPSRLRVYPSFFGFGLYWAWLWLMFFTVDLVPAAARAAVEVNAMRSLCLAVEGVAFFAAVLNLVRKDPLVLKYGVSNSVICVLGALGTAGIIACGSFDLAGGFAGYAASWVAWGVAGALLTVIWGRILDSLSATGICFYLAGSMALGAAVVYVLTYMPTGFVCLAAVSLPLLSTLSAHHARNVIRSDDFVGKIPPAPVTDPAIVPRPLLRILIGVLTYSLALGLMLGMMASHGEGGFDLANRMALASPVIVGAVLAFFAYFRGEDDRALSVLYRFAMPMFVAGFLVLSYFGGSAYTAVAFIAIMGFLCFDVVVMVVLFSGSRHFEHLSIRSFIMGRLVNVFGLSGGWALGLLFAIGSFPFGLTQSGLCLVVACVVVTVSSLTLLERDLFPDELRLSGGAKAESACEAPRQATVLTIDEVIVQVAREGGLSAQETRVFAYLAKGHSRKTIQEKMFIASATVDTHARHVYQKLGVRSRQELIDLVAAVLEGGQQA